VNLLSDIVNYVRRIVKTPSNAQLSDNLIIDYINRFWIMDIDARMQLFDFKTSYTFQTVPGRIYYNMPLYQVQVQPGAQNIASYPVYQGFMAPCYINGVKAAFYTLPESFNNLWPPYTQQQQLGTGDGGSTYTLNVGFGQLVPGHVNMAGIIAANLTQDPPVTGTFITGIPTAQVTYGVTITTQDATGALITATDSGQFLSANQNYGLLMRPGQNPSGDIALSGGYSITQNTVNYQTGQINVTFTDSTGTPVNIPPQTPIYVSCYYFQPGLPRAMLFYNNTITLKNPPDKSYTVQMAAYLTPAAFLSMGDAVPFAYMSEYIARGAARKILSDTGDVEQFAFYEPLFKEQEMLVWKRSQRQNTATRTPTIFSEYQGPVIYNSTQGAT